MQSISEIRIEEVKDYENNEFYYYIYCVKDTGERIEVGKSKIKPQCYKQETCYLSLNRSIDFKIKITYLHFMPTIKTN